MPVSIPDPRLIHDSQHAPSLAGQDSQITKPRRSTSRPAAVVLGGDPSRETRERVRRDREVHVRQPMIDLLGDLADRDCWYEDFAVWRYASTAYWWQNQCAIVRVARNVEIGFRFSLDGLRIAAGWRYASSPQIALFRAAVAADASGRGLENLISSLAADGHEIL